MDRFYRGLIAGIIAGIPMTLWSNITHHFFAFGNLRFLDWTGMIIYGSLPVTLFQQIYAQIIHFLWLGLLGVIFSYLIPKITSQAILGKGIIFALGIGFFTYLIPMLFKVPQLTALHSQTVLNNHIGGIIWGLSLAYVLYLFDRPAIKQD